MLEDLYTRLYKSGDEMEIVHLLQLAYKSWPGFVIHCTSLEHWKWKYLDNPIKDNYIGVGLHNNKIVGVDHAIPNFIKIGDKIHLCSYGADVAVHPDYRRMGIFGRVREVRQRLANEAGVLLNYHVTSNPIIIKTNIKAGRPSFPKKIINLVRITNINKQLENMPVKNAWYYKLGFNVSKTINDLKNISHYFDYHNEKLQVTTVNKFDERINRFWNKVSDHYNFIIQKNITYLNWRYCDHRAGNFHIKQIEGNDNEILGYCVLSINQTQNNYKIGYIIDLLSLPERLDVADALIKDVVGFFDRKRINIVNSLVVKNHPYEVILERHGFLNSRFELKLFSRQLNQQEILGIVKTSPPSKIHFSYGDIDSQPISIPKYG